MFCLICLEHNFKSSLNKVSNIFVDIHSKRYKLTALVDHKQSRLHAQGMKTEHLQRISSINRLRRENRKGSILEQAFSACCFVMKEHLPFTQSSDRF